MVTMSPERIISGTIATMLSSLFESLMPLFITVLIFEVVDFGTGVWKSFVVAKRKKIKFAFESVKAWRTIYKVVFIFLGIYLSALLSEIIPPDGHEMQLAKYFTGFACGVEFWSFLENAAEISNHKVFRALKKIMKNKVDDALELKSGKEE